MLTAHPSRPLAHGALALFAVVCAPVAAIAAESQLKLSGSIVGFVRGPAGVAQMGATVLLINRFDHLVHRVLTNEQGAFGFDFLPADTYSIRVSQTSFAPASKTGVRVTPGERSFLAIQLSSVVSNIQLLGSAPGAATLMSDDWKWVLRSASATRPILRFLPKEKVDDPEVRKEHSFFSETRGLLALSAGDSSNFQNASIADMGTAFALSTQVFGTAHVMFSGNVGYSSANGVPAAAFRTSYRHNTDADFFNPEFKLTVQQVFLPMNTPARFTDGPMAGVRTMSAAVSDHLKFSDHVTAEIGTSLDSVSFGSRMNYVSPYVIATVNLEDTGIVQFGFSSGIPPTGVYQSRSPVNMVSSEAADLRRNVNALALIPRLTVRDGVARVQRSENYEISYRKEFGSRTVSAGFFRESISNAALTMASSDGIYPVDVVPDFNSRSAVFNVGDFARSGFSAAGAQRFHDALTVALIFSRGGALRSDQRALPSDDPNAIRSAVRPSQQNAIAAKASGVLPRSGTAYAVSYQWTDYRALTPGHIFLTNLSSPDSGLNISLRQRVPTPGFIPGHVELSAEMRNLMAQGYLPFSVEGRRLLLIHTPRAVRGGVAFYF